MKYYPDISHWKPVSNWVQVKANCPFIISKATQGTKVDPYLDTFIKNCEAMNIPYWLYVFLNKGDEKAQTEFFIDTVNSKAGKHFVGYILDIEKNNTADSISVAYDLLKRQNKKMILYTMYSQYSMYKSVIDKRDDNTAWWEARYGYNTGYYSLPCHEGVDLHQYTSKGSCPGINGEVDLNSISGLKSESWFTTSEIKKVEEKKEGNSMAVMVGSARIDERGYATGGLAGDQTGKEVATETWYYHPKGWYVLRAKDPKVAEKIAVAMERACANNNIGYDQYQRLTLYNLAKNVGFDPAKVTSKCETDCSALVRVCMAYAGINVANFVTSNQKSVIMATGKFEQLPNSVSKSSDYMKRGDILVTKTKGHTVVVLNDGSKVAKTSTTQTQPTTSSNKVVSTSKTIKAAEPAKSYNKVYSKNYILKGDAHIRNGAGINKKSLGVIKKGASVRCYGYYTRYLGTNWMYVVVSQNGINYTGYISSKMFK